MKSELQILSGPKDKYEQIIREKDSEIEDLEDKIYNFEYPVSENEDDDNTGNLHISTLDRAMMFDRLKDNWHLVTLSDIDAICKL